VALKLVADRDSLAGDGADAQPVTVEAVDAQGRIVPTADNAVTFELTGPGAIIGLNNGNPDCHESEKGNQHSIFHGLGQVILQSNLSQSGPLTLKATADGLTSAQVTINVSPAAAPPAVPVADRPKPATRPATAP
jgi:beta-galactosidase